MTIEEIIEKATDEPLERSEVDALCAQEGMTVVALFETISRQIARGYADGEFTFLFCVGVMNHLFGYATSVLGEAPPTYAFSVYLAFDEGEYHHREDPAGSSPEELYTKPMIAEILASDAHVT